MQIMKRAITNSTAKQNVNGEFCLTIQNNKY